MDWDQKLKGILLDEVEKPAKQGYYIEALARLDALVDLLIEALIVNHFREQAKPIQAVEKVLDKKDFSGAVKAKLLLNEGVIPLYLYKQVREFKEVRNTASHNLFYKEILGERRAKAKGVEGARDVGVERLGEDQLRDGVEKGRQLYAALYETLQKQV